MRRYDPRVDTQEAVLGDEGGLCKGLPPNLQPLTPGPALKAPYVVPSCQACW
jgi:hypothetical protein